VSALSAAPTVLGIIPGFAFGRHPILSGTVNWLVALVMTASLVLVLPRVVRRRRAEKGGDPIDPAFTAGISSTVRVAP
jgi:hypothetical protein